MSRWILATVTGALVVGSSPVQADELEECAQAAVEALERQGGRLDGQRVGFLLEGTSETSIFELEADTCVAYLGVGHRRVQDLDIALHTESGIALAQDVELDAHAYVRYCGGAGLRMTVTTLMYKGRGEYRLLRFLDAPASLPDLNRAVGGCFASRMGLRHPPADVGPEAPGLSAEEAGAAVRQTLGDLGYRPHLPPRALRLVERESASEAVSLPSDRCFAAVAAAGPGVADVDLAVRGGDGRPLGRDRERGSHAVARFCVDAAGEHLVDVRVVRGAGDVRVEVLALDEPRGPRPNGVDGAARAPYAEVVARLTRHGLRPRALSWGLLSPGRSLSMPVRLEAGRCYGVAGVPDDGLPSGDLDLLLLDDTGALRAWELSSDATPVLYHCPDRTALHRVVGRAFGARGRYLVVIGEDR